MLRSVLLGAAVVLLLASFQVLADLELTVRDPGGGADDVAQVVMVYPGGTQEDLGYTPAGNTSGRTWDLLAESDLLTIGAGTYTVRIIHDQDTNAVCDPTPTCQEVTGTYEVTFGGGIVVAAVDDDAAATAGIPTSIAVLSNDLLVDASAFSFGSIPCPLSVPAPGCPCSEDYTTGNPCPSSLVAGVNYVQGQFEVTVGDPALSLLSVGAPSHGTTSISGDEAIYTPAGDFCGTDSFTYSVQYGASVDTGTVTVDVAGIPPTAGDDSATVAEDGSVLVGVLANDVGTLLSLDAVGVPDHGHAAIVGDRVEYTPSPDYWGGDTFTYTIVSPCGGADEGLVTLTVEPVDDPVDAIEDSGAVAEDGTLVVVAPGVLGNDSYVDGGPSATVVDDVENGTLILNPDGSYTYVPVADYFGADGFTYELSDVDGDTDQAVVTLTVTSVDDPVDAVAERYSTLEATALAVPAPGILENDSAPDGGASTALAVDASHGIVVVAVDGSFHYTPDPRYVGVDSFVYELSDTDGDTDRATVEIRVEHVNEPPVADAGSSYRGTTQEPIVLSALFSSDPDIQDTLEYRWDTDGDGEWDTDWAADPTLETVYERPYRGIIAVEVRDLSAGIVNGTSDRATALALILPGPTQIAVSIFADLNGNGEFDEEDVGLEGVVLLLDGETEVVTGEDGIALLDDVTPGEHTLEISEDGIAYLRDRGFFLADTGAQVLEIGSGEWAGLLFRPEVRGFLEVDLGAEEEQE
ncbi:MAG: tandem-95 repeat protein [Candidatus Bipolaricaulota bacterium]|nr:MAG: tandem-95 repeat protein [Candidatus Bipolaricaulota bacterium]